VVPPDGDPALVAVNDGPDAWPLRATVTRRNLAGDVLAAARLDATVAPGGAVTLTLPADVVTPGDPATELLVADTGDERAWWFFARDRDIPWPAPELRAEVDGGRVTVTAGTILRALTLYPDRLDPAAEADRAGVTLLPGESVTFTIRSDRPLDPAALSARPVLRSVNDLHS
jgi:beta-mannosidase